MTIPGIAWVLGYTIAAEIGDIARFPSPRKLIGYTGLCPRVYQSGEPDRRGPLRKNGPDYLRWALIEAAHTPPAQPAYPAAPVPRTAPATAATAAPSRRDRDRPQAHRGDLVDAHPQPALCSGKRPESLTALTVPKRIAPPEQAPIQPDRPPRAR